MAGWNGSGSFTFPYNWEADAAAGINILATRMDTQFNYVAVQGFGNTLTRDGQGQPSANLPMNGFKHTGAAVAVASGEYVTYQQVTAAALNVEFIDLTTTGNVEIGGTASVTGASTLTGDVTAEARLFVAGRIIQSSGNAPTSSGASGIVGSVAWDTDYLYIATNTNTWKRVALSAF